MREANTSLQKKLAETLHDALAQHLTGTLLAAQALLQSLRGHNAAEAHDAEKLVQLLKEANGDLNELIRRLDKGAPR